MCKVPQETKSALPRRKSGHLYRCRIDTVTEALVDQHGTIVRPNTKIIQHKRESLECLTRPARHFRLNGAVGRNVANLLAESNMATPGIFKELGLLTTTEAADIVGVHRNTIWNAIRHGHLPKKLIGNAVGLDPKDVADFRDRYINGKIDNSVIPAAAEPPEST